MEHGQIRLVEGIPPVQTVPLEDVRLAGSDLSVSLDVDDGSRVRLVFGPHQALRVTTEDCFDRIPRRLIPTGGLYEVLDSDWVSELATTLERLDPNADFMDHARHFVLPAGDNVIEVVAWSVEAVADV